MTDIYIATPTQADYDALMRLAEAAGFKWMDGDLPTEYDTWTYAEEQTVVHLYNDFQEGRRMMRDDRAYYESQNATIETIPNIAGIKAIWNVKPEYLDVFSNEKLNTSDVIKDWALNDGVVILLENGSYDLGFEEVYKTLAVEYTPKESEDIMPEKVKLPKFMCTLIDISVNKKITTPELAYRVMDKLADESIEANKWLGRFENRWKLLNALHYGYEAEPEPRWGIKAGHSYLYEPNDKSFGPDEEPFAYDSREQAEEVVARLGFGEVVDLNKEDKADD